MTTPPQAAPQCAPFLTFCGRAEEAMLFYAKALPGAAIESITRWKAGQPGDVGKVLTGVLTYKGLRFMFMDMQAGVPVPDMSWTTSFYIECDDEAEFDAVFKNLADGGSVMMGPEPVLAMRMCAWVVDKYGLTWQPVWR